MIISIVWVRHCVMHRTLDMYAIGYLFMEGMAFVKPKKTQVSDKK